MKSYREQFEETRDEGSTFLLIADVDLSSQNVEFDAEEMEPFFSVVFSDCNLKRVPLFFRNIPHNKGVGLPNNKIERIESNDFPTNGIRSLNLSNNPLSYIDIEGGEGLIEISLKKINFDPSRMEYLNSQMLKE